MSLDLAQIVAASSGPQSASNADKTAALASWLAQVLALHGTGWTVATYVDPRLLSTSLDAETRAEIMGRPARYAEVIWTGTAEGYDPTAVADLYSVGIAFGTGADVGSAGIVAASDAAQAAFRALCRSSSETTPGVLYAAERQAEIMTAAGHTVYLGAPQSVLAGRMPGDPRRQDETLTLAFTIGLE
jgi:hypothetical protein